MTLELQMTAKRKGRPPELEGQPRYKTIGISVSEQEHREISEAAKKLGIPIAELARNALKDCLRGL